MNRTLLNGVLALTVLGLGTAVYLANRKTDALSPLTALKADAIQTIRIEHPGAPAIAMEKNNGQWRLTAPVQADVDALEANGVIALASFDAQQTLDPATVNPKELGLDPPRYAVTFNDQKIEIGGEEPIQYRRYARVGNTIALIANPPSAGLDADYSDLISKQLVPSGAEIQSVETATLRLTRSADGKSWVTGAAHKSASADARQKLADAWRDARAMWNGAMPEDAKGERVTLKTSTGVLTFLITQREPQLILARPDLKVSYTLSGELTKELLSFNETPVAESASAVGTNTAP